MILRSATTDVLALERDAKRLCKQAKKNGRAVATFGGHYRATLYARPWRLILVPMPMQSPDAGEEKDPNGNSWNLGATITAAILARACRTQWKAKPPPDIPGQPQQLAWVFEQLDTESLN